MNVYNIPQCAAASSPDLSNKTEYPYFFRSVSSDVIGARAFVTLAQNMNWKRVAVLTPNSPFGLGYLKAFQASAVGSGVQIIASKLYPLGNQNFTSQIKDFKDLDAKIFYLFSNDPDYLLILKVNKDLIQFIKGSKRTRNVGSWLCFCW